MSRPPPDEHLAGLVPDSCRDRHSHAGLAPVLVAAGSVVVAPSTRIIFFRLQKQFVAALTPGGTKE